MNKCFRVIFSAVLMLGCLTFSYLPVCAGEAVIKEGIYAGDIDLSGLNGTEAREAINKYITSLEDMTITLIAAEDNRVDVSVGELGITWGNQDLVAEALEIGTGGNVIQRYKVLKDLQYENKIFPIELSFDRSAIEEILQNRCVAYDVKAQDARLVKEEDSFQVIEGQVGYKLDIETSREEMYEYLTTDWDHNSCEFSLIIEEEQPKGSAEELAEVKDLLGTFTTSYTTSGSARSANVENGCHLIDGTTIYPGEEFSTYLTVSPFTVANGYYMAGSYLNGRVVDSLGGGICQVSTTLYNAVLKAELEISERHNHSMIVSYVSASADAAIAESAGKDFCFVNNTDYPIYIEGYTQGKKITFNIYGKETRAENRKVRYESEILEIINPQSDTIYVDAGQPIGYIVTESAHIGYKAKLWKVVTEDGVEVSRTLVNSSNYKMSPRCATVGVATADPNAYNEIMAAIGTANIDHVKNVIAILTAPQTP